MIASNKQKSLSVLISELDKVFSEYIRRKSADSNGLVTCFVTGVACHWKQSDAAHYVDRTHMHTRYDEMNVHATCVATNRFDTDHKAKYRHKMYEVYGVDRVIALENRGHSLFKYMRPDLIKMIEDFKERIKNLKK